MPQKNQSGLDITSSVYSKQLNSGAILILKASWQLFKDDPVFLQKQGITETRSRLELMEKKTKLHADLIDLYERHLRELNLISPRQFSDGSGIVVTECRLTPLPKTLCEMITRSP